MSSLNFPRVVILVGLLGSGVLGYFVYERTERLSQLERNLAQAPGMVTTIQAYALELNDLQKQAKNDKFNGIEDAESYIRTIAAMKDVGIGQVTTTRRERPRGKGVRDDIVGIDPSVKTRAYTRSQIGNFLYKLEADSPRVKVTSFTLTPMGKVKAGEIGPDEWKFEAELTSRTRDKE